MSYYVYIIRQASSNYIKIGVTDDLRDRLYHLQTGNPVALELRYAVECLSEEDAFKLENLLHERYKSRRVALEWFDIPFTKVVNDLDWCISMASLMKGGTEYYRRSHVMPGKSTEAGDHPISCSDCDWSGTYLTHRSSVNALVAHRKSKHPAYEFSSNGHGKGE